MPGLSEVGFILRDISTANLSAVILYLCFSAVHPFDYGNDADALGSQDDQLTQDPNATISMRRSKPPVGVLAHLLRRKDTLQRIIRGRVSSSTKYEISIDEFGVYVGSTKEMGKHERNR